MQKDAKLRYCNGIDIVEQYISEIIMIIDLIKANEILNLVQSIEKLSIFELFNIDLGYVIG